MRSDPLDGCTCQVGQECRHSWSRLHPQHPKLQVNYLFVVAALSKELEYCEALPSPEWAEYSDHSPIIARFKSNRG